MASIAAAFDKLAPLTGNASKFIRVNSGATGQEAVSSTGSGSVVLATGATIGTPAISGGTVNNAVIGGSTPAAGTFTTLTATGAVSGAGITSLFASPPAIGGTTAAAATVTNLTFSGMSRRIIGEFSATLSNNSGFQTSLTDGNTNVMSFPNGTAQNAFFVAVGNSSGSTPVNTSFFGENANSETSIWNLDFSAGAASTGKIVFKLLSSGGTALGEMMRISADGTVDIAGDSTASTQGLRVPFTSGSTRHVIITGSVAGNPKVATSGGSLDLGSAVILTGQTVGTTVGAAGGASALPATPLGYLTTSINGTACKIPYYNV